MTSAGASTPRPAAASVAVGAAAGYAALEVAWSLLRVLEVGPRQWQWAVGVLSVLVVLGLTAGAAAAADRSRMPAGPPSPLASRRRTSGQLLAVMALFPLAAAIRAVGFLVDGYCRHRPPAPWVGDLVPGHPGWTTVLDVAAALGEIGAALGLVSVLLRSAGEPGLAALGLDTRHPELDVARALPLLLGTLLLPLTLGQAALRHAGVVGLSPSDNDHPLYTLVDAADALAAGLVEEVCVLGFLVWCGRRAGWSTGRLVFVAVLARTSFHLYYGWDVLPLVAWALLTVLAFLCFPPVRVAPFVLAHWCFDLGQALPGWWAAAPYVPLTLGWAVAVHRAAQRDPEHPVRWFLRPDSAAPLGPPEPG